MSTFFVFMAHTNFCRNLSRSPPPSAAYLSEWISRENKSSVLPGMTPDDMVSYIIVT